MSTPNIEITIPATYSEVKLLTADKYCESDIIVKNEKSFKCVSGNFTPSEDTTIIEITGLPANVKLLEICAESTPGNAVTGRIPIEFCYVHTAVKLQTSDECRADVKYLRPDGAPTISFSLKATYNPTDGTVYPLVDETSPYKFVENMQYNWVAYCWDD